MKKFLFFLFFLFFSTSLYAQTPVNIKMVGDVPVTSLGIPVTTNACSGSTCQINGVIGAAVAVTTTTVAPFGTTTTLVQSLEFNNVCAANVTVTVTDGNNVPFIGTTTNGTSFTINPIANYPVPMGLTGYIFTSGLNVSASVANCIKMWTSGKQ